MNRHATPNELAAFAAGDLPDAVAATLAEHLDACPHCAARAEALEPLSPLFAHHPEPVLPFDLAASALRAASAPDPRPAQEPAGPGAEVAVGAGLLAASGLLASASGDAPAALADLGRLFGVLSHLSWSLPAALPTAIAVAVLGAAAVAVARRPEAFRLAVAWRSDG